MSATQGYYMSRDRINDLLIQPVINKVDHNAILACQDRLVPLPVSSVSSVSFLHCRSARHLYRPIAFLACYCFSTALVHTFPRAYARTHAHARPRIHTHVHTHRFVRVLDVNKLHYESFVQGAVMSLSALKDASYNDVLRQKKDCGIPTHTHAYHTHAYHTHAITHMHITHMQMHMAYTHDAHT
jgi:hypothetical protein